MEVVILNKKNKIRENAGEVIYRQRKIIAVLIGVAILSILVTISALLPSSFYIRSTKTATLTPTQIKQIGCIDGVIEGSINIDAESGSVTFRGCDGATNYLDLGQLGIDLAQFSDQTAQRILSQIESIDLSGLPQDIQEAWNDIDFRQLGSDLQRYFEGFEFP